MSIIDCLKYKHLSDHFSVAELTKTSFKTSGGNIPNGTSLRNLTRLCRCWLEPLRQRYNQRYCLKPDEDYATSQNVEGIVINHGFRSHEVMERMRRAGYHPSSTSNHFTGCAVDIGCLGFEQAIRYACILIDIADEFHQDYDELFIEQNDKGTYWIHLAARPGDNRRKHGFLRG